jgi:hypothetical protein
MDHDLMAKEVTGLKQFKQRAEEAIAFYEGIKAAGGLPPAAPGASGMSPEERQKLDDIGAQLQVLLASNEDFSTKLDALQVARVDFSAKIEGVDRLLEGVSGLKDMAEWFAQNREGLEILLSMDGEPDKPEETAAPAAQVETAQQQELAAAPADQPQPDPATPPAPAPSEEPGA